MYRITLTIENPQTRSSQSMVYKFDPALMTQTKWNNAYAQVKAEMDALVAASAPNEPPTW